MSKFIFLIPIILSLVLIPTMVDAHSNGCHRWHSCPSDANPPTYQCGDTGHTKYCPVTPNPPPLECGYMGFYETKSQTCVPGKVIITTDKIVNYSNSTFNLSFQLLGNWGAVEKQYYVYIKSPSYHSPLKQIYYTYDPSLRNQTTNIQIAPNDSAMRYNGTYYFLLGVSPHMISPTFEYHTVN